MFRGIVWRAVPIGVTLALATGVAVSRISSPDTSAAYAVQENAVAVEAEWTDDRAEASPLRPAEESPAPRKAKKARPKVAPATVVVAAAPSGPVLAAPKPSGSGTKQTSTRVPRRYPSSAEVQAAIREIKSRVGGGLFFRLTEAQAREFADEVCTAFDQGHTYAEVKSVGMAKVANVPFVNVDSSDADFAIRKAVELVCPGHEPKLP